MKQLIIQSHKGPYAVDFGAEPFGILEEYPTTETHYLVDRQVAKLYSKQLTPILSNRSVLLIDANEYSKSLSNLETYIESLVNHSIRRDHTLVAVGGGVIQDITCFLASTLFRGMSWEFIPTTLLAQADSCIGSKSSINVTSVKNLLGTFYPPRRIVISHAFLQTLSSADFRSGVGEMLKVHIIEGPSAFEEIAKAYTQFSKDPPLLEHFVFESLRIKQKFAECDEFDKGARNVMNYGHSFGHAIEVATNFAIPHGIAVTLGMDLANYVAFNSGRIAKNHYDEMSSVLQTNAAEFLDTSIDLDAFIQAIGKDKKNVGNDLGLILLDSNLMVEKVRMKNDDTFRHLCASYLEKRNAA